MLFFIIGQEFDKFFASVLSVFLGGADKNRYRLDLAFALYPISVFFPVFQMIIQNHLKTLVAGQVVVAFFGPGPDIIVNILDIFLFRSVPNGIVVNNIGKIVILVIGRAGKTDMPGDLLVFP